ncbi:MAG: phosphotransferase, partial [Alphaproteobacteria bacterium]|nr:phosphotransferase [Alphaproteobacteria bacterium]
QDGVQSAENTIRYLTIYGTDDFASRLAAIATYSPRDHALMQFIDEHGWQSAKYTPILGDASSRRYMRLVRDKIIKDKEGKGVKSDPARAAMYNVTKSVLMDWPPRALIDKQKTTHKRKTEIKPDKSYAARTFLARDVSSFVAIANFLISCGLSAPQIYGYDFANGFLLLEDFGTQTFTNFLDMQDKGLPIYYREAIAALAHLHKQNVPADWPLPNGDAYQLHSFDIDVLMAELGQFFDFYLAGQGIAISETAHKNWQAIWRTILPKAATMPPVLVLRDYHSPNLHWLEARQTIARIGMIDIQDALLGSPAYDVVSLLQDARRDIDEGLCARLLNFYFEERQLNKPAEQETFKMAYAILGAQRNFRIAGVFTRLAKYNNKPSYLVHLPRVMNYIEKNLQHPALADVAIWMQENIPTLK